LYRQACEERDDARRELAEVEAARQALFIQKCGLRRELAEVKREMEQWKKAAQPAEK
jgi:hypothetical protein